MSAIHTFGMDKIQERVKKFTPQNEETFVATVQKAIDDSFRGATSCRRTGVEEKRRLGLCTEIMCQFIEVGAPMEQALETLPGSLRVLIEGGELELDPDGSMWQVHGSNMVTKVSKEYFDKGTDINETECGSEDDLNDMLQRMETE